MQAVLRMIARNGNYWKSYKSCGTAMLLTPVDMFGGPKVKWDDTLQVQMLKWCYFHLKPVLEHLVKEPRLEFVHEKHLPWDDEKVCQECGDPLPLEPRWWRKSTRFREVLQASFAPYSMGYVRTSQPHTPFSLHPVPREELGHWGVGPPTESLVHGCFTKIAGALGH